MPADACVKCNAPLERPAVGRPAGYCSNTCKRAAEYERQRLQRHLESLENYASSLRLLGDPDRQVRNVEREIGRAEQRLRELLASAEPEPVSPAWPAGDG